MNREKLDAILLANLGNRELVEKWWHSPNLSFKSYTPTEMLDIDHKAVVQYILGQLNGDYA